MVVWSCCFGPVASQAIMVGTCVCRRRLVTSRQLGSKERQEGPRSQYSLRRHHLTSLPYPHLQKRVNDPEGTCPVSRELGPTQDGLTSAPAPSSVSSAFTFASLAPGNQSISASRINECCFRTLLGGSKASFLPQCNAEL